MEAGDHRTPGGVDYLGATRARVGIERVDRADGDDRVAVDEHGAGIVVGPGRKDREHHAPRTSVATDERWPESCGRVKPRPGFAGIGCPPQHGIHPRLTDPKPPTS